MGYIDVSEIDNYGGNGSAGFFSLKNDKDTAVVRFMYESAQDIKPIVVHEIDLGDKKRYVSCLSTGKEPCAFCEAKIKSYVKLFIPLYDIDADEVKVWERGRNFVSKMTSLTSRYQPLVSTPFEIERNGKPNDTGTTYETYAQQSDGTMLEDLPELPVILGGLVLEKSYDEMNFYLDYGYFEEVEAAGEEELPFNKEDNRRPANNARQPERNPQSDRRPVNASGAQTGRTQGATPNNANTQRRTPANSTSHGNTAPAGRRPAQNSRDKF